jgi:hypothetical protein
VKDNNPMSSERGEKKENTLKREKEREGGGALRKNEM